MKGLYISSHRYNRMSKFNRQRMAKFMQGRMKSKAIAIRRKIGMM